MLTEAATFSRYSMYVKYLELRILLVDVSAVQKVFETCLLLCLPFETRSGELEYYIRGFAISCYRLCTDDTAPNCLLCLHITDSLFILCDRRRLPSWLPNMCPSSVKRRCYLSFLLHAITKLVCEKFLLALFVFF